MVMLAAQTSAITVLMPRPDASAERALGGLGAAMSGDLVSGSKQRLIPAAGIKRKHQLSLPG